MIDRAIFFARVRVAFGALTQAQVDGFSAVLDEWDRRRLSDLRWLAYMLATAWHETGAAMQAIIEAQQRGESRVSVDLAIARLESSWKRGRLPWVSRPYWRRDGEGKSWLGRGLVQLTHRVNYEKLGSRLRLDLVGNPDRALELPVAVAIMFEGMIEGLFTGHKLVDYFHGGASQWAAARKIINGTDKAALIAGYALSFHTALLQAQREPPAKPAEKPAGGHEPSPAPSPPAPLPASPPAPAPEPARPIPVLPEPARPAPGFWARFWAALSKRKS